jgi:hypothetical protein
MLADSVSGEITPRAGAGLWGRLRAGRPEVHLVIAGHAEAAFELAAAKLSDSNCAAFSDMLEPAAFK